MTLVEPAMFKILAGIAANMDPATRQAVFRFGSYLPTPTSYSLIGQLYTFKLVDQLRSLIIIRILQVLVNHIECARLVIIAQVIRLHLF